MLAEFFALLRDGETRRIPLERAIQEQVSAHFYEGAGRYLDADLEVIPLERCTYDPGEGEAWVIAPFDPPEGLADALGGVRTLPDLARHEVIELQVKAIGARFHPRGGDTWIALQAMDRRKVLLPGSFGVILDGGTYSRMQEPALQLGGPIQAVLVDGKLLFESVEAARRIVDIGQYYQEATAADLRRFCQCGALAMEDEEAFFAVADNWMRKRVALIVDSGILERCSAARIAAIARDYDIPITIVREGGRERIRIPSSKRDVKELLRLFSEDFFAGPLSQAQYVANSKRRRAGH